MIQNLPPLRLLNTSALISTTIGKADDGPDILHDAINNTLEDIGEENRDIASWPNPFYKYNPRNKSNADSTILALVDGVDVIFAVDGSADTKTQWPSGTAPVATYQRSKVGTSAQNSQFPKIPDQNTFINLGLNKKPAFFGCDTGLQQLSNFTTFDLEYSNTERNEIIRNGYNVATMGNGTVHSDWSACVGCAILARSLARTDTEIPSKYVDCFGKYCWNGTTNSKTPGTYEPEQIITSGVGHPVPFMGR
ncbi:hypothetical protein BFJ69_g16612 [Fusarium oxysporum]|uniref:Lysophospholipase n=1 Tax=Fusarium oxysporum TaxID=5507 RepID=A0A420MAQ9_FUSOX|nr:hypothetical protein BFJ69_g16612 [Fusarium oxysporum]